MMRRCAGRVATVAVVTLAAAIAPSATARADERDDRRYVRDRIEAYLERFVELSRAHRPVGLNAVRQEFVDAIANDPELADRARPRVSKKPLGEDAQRVFNIVHDLAFRVHRQFSDGEDARCHEATWKWEPRFEERCAAAFGGDVRAFLAGRGDSGPAQGEEFVTDGCHANIWIAGWLTMESLGHRHQRGISEAQRMLRFHYPEGRTFGALEPEAAALKVVLEGIDTARVDVGCSPWLPAIWQHDVERAYATGLERLRSIDPDAPAGGAP